MADNAEILRLKQLVLNVAERLHLAVQVIQKNAERKTRKARCGFKWGRFRGFDTKGGGKA